MQETAETAELVTLTGKILNGKLHFLGNDVTFSVQIFFRSFQVYSNNLQTKIGICYWIFTCLWMPFLTVKYTFKIINKSSSLMFSMMHWLLFAKLTINNKQQTIKKAENVKWRVLVVLLLNINTPSTKTTSKCFNLELWISICILGFCPVQR